MTVCAYRQEDGVFGGLNRIDDFNMSESEAEIFKYSMGTFLLRRARYFSEAEHQFASPDESGLAEMKSFHPRPLTSPSLR